MTERFNYSRLALAALLVAALVGITPGCSGPTSQELFQQAASAHSSGQLQTALKLATKAVAKDEHNTAAVLLRGLTLHHLRKTEQALEGLEAAALEAPQDFAAQYFYGWVLCENRLYGDALAPLKRAYAIRKDHPDLLVLLARCCIEQNLREGVSYLQALRRFPSFRDSPELYNGLALLWLGELDYEQALENLRIAHQKAPRNAAVMQNLAVLYDQYFHDPVQALRYYRYCLAESQRVDDRQRSARVQRRLRAMAQERTRRDGGNE